MLSGEQDVLLNALLSDPVVVGNVFLCKYIERDREGNGIPLQYSCLENPMDGGAW